MLAACSRAPPLLRGLRLGSRALSSDRPSAWDPRSAVHGKPPKEEQGQWDPSAAVHGKPPEEAPLIDEVPGWSVERHLKRALRGRSREGPRFEAGASPRSAGLLNTSREAQHAADMLQFQSYVRQRLAEVNARMPPAMETKELAELHFLEQAVIDDHMPAKRRALRDPLKDVPMSEITCTNLNLLSRFVSESGAILPKRLTGVSPEKQKRLTKAIKHAQQLALMPKTWKLPKYRHATYANSTAPAEAAFSRVDENDEFSDPPDIRYPGVPHEVRKSLLDLSGLATSSSNSRAVPRSPFTGGTPPSDGGAEGGPAGAVES